MKKLSAFFLIFVLLLSSCSIETQQPSTASNTSGKINVGTIPAFDDFPYAVLNSNEPEFTAEELKAEAYEFYSELDSLGRCGVTVACISKELMPDEDRGSIQNVKPTGWHTVKYDIVDGLYLYNRCHLIGYQLTGENANEKNLITGTRYMNVEGMLPFEDMVADYIKETDNHVLYRVTPIFHENELVARGVQMEAKSIEDNGEGICFNVYVYNNQPGININYQTGESALEGDPLPSNPTEVSSAEIHFILNTSSKKFHKPTCGSADSIAEHNRGEYTGSREDLINQGYSPCGSCKP